MALTLKATGQADDPLMLTVGAVSPPAERNILKGTPQQQAFWEELVTGDRNVLLEARAGTGKSTSCREGMWRILDKQPRATIRYCCFNKKIADEFQIGCPDGVEVGTMHRFGLAALYRAGQVKVEANRSYLLMDAIGGYQTKSFRNNVSRLVSLAKNHAFRPDNPNILFGLEMLLDYYDVETWGRADAVVDMAYEVLKRSARDASVVDFDDMLWLPVLRGMTFPALDYLFIDECQDLNPVQHELAALLCAHGRTIIVGDPYQSIYAFRGADTESIPRLQRQLDALVLPLTMSFRCPWTHVELAKRLVPDFEAAENAIAGTVAHLGHEGINAALPGDLILCRSNAPLVRECLNLIGQRKRATMRGRGFSTQLGSLLRRLPPANTITELRGNIASWRRKELDKLADKDGVEDLMERVEDKAACLEAIADSCESPAEVFDAIRLLFDDQSDTRNTIVLSTVHRAKGSEAKRVFLIDQPYGMNRRPNGIPQWEADQRRNLRYVALTRSLDSLFFLPAQ